MGSACYPSSVGWYCPMCYEVDVAETAIVEHCLIQDGRPIDPAPFPSAVVVFR